MVEAANPIIIITTIIIIVIERKKLLLKTRLPFLFFPCLNSKELNYGAICPMPSLSHGEQ
jgi:hypothetical protein